jgi:hypothetical protein
MFDKYTDPITIARNNAFTENLKEWIVRIIVTDKISEICQIKKVRSKTGIHTCILIGIS